MRKLKLQVQMTIDGFIGGVNGEMDWINPNWSEDIKAYVQALTQTVDTILLGKNLAMGFIPHWEAVAKDNNNPDKDAGIIFSAMPKIVFSKTLTSAAQWNNTAIENGNFVEKITALKNQAGQDIMVYGGGTFVSSLIKENLIDELHLFLNPAILGKGMPIFQSIDATKQMTLLSSKHFECGIIVLVYKPN